MKSYLKFIALALFFFLIANCTLKIEDCKCQWSLQTNPLSTSIGVGKIQFVTSTEGWISCGQGNLLHTTNAGTNWLVVTPFPNDTVTSFSDPAITMCWINQTHGWKNNIIGNYSNFHGAVIHLTTDGGITWQKKVLSSLAGEMGVQVQFVNVNTGWASVGNLNTGGGKLMKSTNGGNNWSVIDTSSADGGIFYFTDVSNGWSIKGGQNPSPPFTIKHTTNGGVNWAVQYTDNTQGEFVAIQFTDLNNGWVAGRYRKILKTNNGGTNWIQFNNTGLIDSAYAKCMFFLNANTGWIGENYYVPPPQQTPLRVLIYTSNGGNSWTQQIPSILSWNNTIFSIYFNDAQNGWFTAENGVIAHTTNSGIGIKHISSDVPSDYSLHQNFPNPFNPTTSILYELPKKGFVKLVIFDALGRELETLVKEKQSAGTYEATFNASQYSSGVYFYRLTTDGFSETKKMILLK
jgi:photosystem II stability/assembly factor-like uncharacterized protein